MNIGLVGLGLIGGSMARAIRKNTDHKIYGYDIDETTMLAAKLVGSIDGTLDDTTIPECDFVIISVYPEDTVKCVEDNAKKFKKGALVIDCSGVKRVVCDSIRQIADENGFVFIGGHPMAGTNFWGFNHSSANMFDGASMIIMADNISDINLLESIKSFFLSIGFGSLTYTTPEDHDRIIAYTSQLAHIVSSAYVKSPTAKQRKGFSAGSYRDLTRVAHLNESMWTELFFNNKDYLEEELDMFIENLKAYSDALKADDHEKMNQLLKEGRETKIQAG